MNKEMQGVINEKVEIMIMITIEILGCSYSEAYSVIESSKTYSKLNELDYCTMYDSPQANLSAIGEELRQQNNELGNFITDKNIIQAMIDMRERNLQRKKKDGKN